MMKIGTISLNIHTHDLNYGAVLHSWAFQQYLLKYKNVETEVIDYTTPKYWGVNLKYPTVNLLKSKKVIPSIVSLVRLFSHSKRFDKFEKFVKNNFRLSKQKYSLETLKKADLDYDTLVCESDVIWSPGFFGGEFDPAFFLHLQSMKGKRKIAYAPSMSNGGLNKRQEKEICEWTKDFCALSARESYTVEYLKSICERTVEWVLDPVFLLNAKEYDKITSNRLINEPYLLLYFPLEYNIEIIKRAKEYAKMHNLKVVELSRFPWDKLSHKTITDAGIEEFLSLIKYSDMVFSNSFHAVCFAAIYQKQFIGFSRKTGLKIKDICERLGVPDHFVQAESMNLNVSTIDYRKVNEILDKEIARSKEFIEKSILCDA